MRFIIYKNSILATFCSMFGAAFIAMGVASMFSGELGILAGIGVIAGGLGFMWLGDFISKKKAERKQKKAQQTATQTASRTAAHSAVNSGASNAGKAQAAPQRTYERADSSHSAAQNTYVQPTVAPVISGKPAGKSLAFAGVFFVTATLLALWSLYLYRKLPHFMANSEQVALYVACPLLAIAAFRTRQTQKISVLFVIGFALMTFASVDVSLTTYRAYGFGAYSDNSGIYYAMTLSHILKAASYFLMAVFALFSMQKRKNQLGGIVKWLWFLPIPVLLLAFAKEISNSSVPYVIQKLLENGITWKPRYDLLEAAASIWAIFAVLFSGFAFQSFCRNAESHVQPQYANPAPVQPGNRIACPHCHQMNEEGSVFCAGCGQRIVQPQPMREPVPEPVQKPHPSPVANAPTAPKNVQKEMEAYKDLLDCGILTQEEYDQKIRELTRG